MSGILGCRSPVPGLRLRAAPVLARWRSRCGRTASSGSSVPKVPQTRSRVSRVGLSPHCRKSHRSPFHDRGRAVKSRSCRFGSAAEGAQHETGSLHADRICKTFGTLLARQREVNCVKLIGQGQKCYFGVASVTKRRGLVVQIQKSLAANGRSVKAARHWVMSAVRRDNVRKANCYAFKSRGRTRPTPQRHDIRIDISEDGIRPRLA